MTDEFKIITFARVLSSRKDKFLEDNFILLNSDEIVFLHLPVLE